MSIHLHIGSERFEGSADILQIGFDRFYEREDGGEVDAA